MTDEIERLQRRLSDLREKLVSWEEKIAPSRDSYPGRNYESARNLIHYLALRSEDLRPLQASLARHAEQGSLHRRDAPGA